MNRQKQLQRAGLFSLILLCESCAEIDTLGNNEEIASYAESVFRRQNAVTSRIMMSMDETLLDDSQFQRAEMAMYDACQLLNEYSSKEMDGEPIGMWFKRRVRASIKGCDDSIRQVENLLESY